MCSNFFLFVAVSASFSESIRRLPYGALKELNQTVPVSFLNLSESHVTNQSETVVSTGVPGALVEKAGQNFGKTEPGNLQQPGRCCTVEASKNRFNVRMHRWFYYQKQDGKYEPVHLCPGHKMILGKWKATQASACDGAEQYNQVDYKEDTDWVICCDKGAKKKGHFFYAGKDCSKATKGSCKDHLNCEEHTNVDEKDIKCKDKQEKTVNADVSWACPHAKRPTNFPDMTDMQCAGYAENCAQNSCIGKGVSEDGNQDCSEPCLSADGYEMAKKAVYLGSVKIWDKKVPKGTEGARPINDSQESGAALIAVNRFWLLLSIVAGAVLPALP